MGQDRKFSRMAWTSSKSKRGEMFGLATPKPPPETDCDARTAALPWTEMRLSTAELVVLQGAARLTAATGQRLAILTDVRRPLAVTMVALSLLVNVLFVAIIVFSMHV